MSALGSFDLKTPLPPRLVLGKLRERLMGNPGEMSGVVAEARVDLFAPPHSQRHGARQLIFDVEAYGKAGSILRCRFCSHPHDWVLRVGLLAMGAVGLMISVCLACAQYALGQSPKALWGLAPLGLLFGVSWVRGKRKDLRGQPQARELQQFLEQEIAAIEHQVHPRRERS